MGVAVPIKLIAIENAAKDKDRIVLISGTRCDMARPLGTAESALIFLRKDNQTR
jgi:hypothetical protein